MLDNIIACTGYEEPFELMLEGFQQTLKEEDFITLFKRMNKEIIELKNELECIRMMEVMEVASPVVEITEVKE